MRPGSTALTRALYSQLRGPRACGLSVQIERALLRRPLKGNAMRLAVCLATVLLAPAAAAWADEPRTSWGKADVDFTQYRSDAAYCAYAALTTTWAHADESPNPDFVHEGASAATSAVPQAPDPTTPTPADLGSVQSQNRLSEAREARRYHSEAQAAVDACLTERGYTRFRLTDTQRSRLRTLAHGTPERQRYLYSLAIDPEVLRAQADPPRR